MTRICKSCNFAKTNFYQGHSSCVECVKSRQQKWYQNNKSRNYANARKSKLSDSVRAHNYDAKYRSKPNNKERQRLHNANRRARERNAQGEFTAKDICELMEKQNGCCNHCGHNIRHKYHIDHIVPLINGGSNFPTNLQLLCPTCNTLKGSRPPPLPITAGPLCTCPGC